MAPGPPQHPEEGDGGDGESFAAFSGGGGALAASSGSGDRDNPLGVSNSGGGGGGGGGGRGRVGSVDVSDLLRAARLRGGGRRSSRPMVREWCFFGAFLMFGAEKGQEGVDIQMLYPRKTPTGCSFSCVDFFFSYSDFSNISTQHLKFVFLRRFCDFVSVIFCGQGISAAVSSG